MSVECLQSRQEKVSFDKYGYLYCEVEDMKLLSFLCFLRNHFDHVVASRVMDHHKHRHYTMFLRWYLNLIKESPRFIEWCDASQEVSVFGYVMMNLKGLVPAAGVLLSCILGITNGFFPLGPVLLMIGIASSIPLMYATGKKYDGFVGSMSLPHLVLTVPGTFVVWANHTDAVMTNFPIYSAWSYIQLGVFGVSHALDLWTMLNWYVLKNRTVMRCHKHIEEWQKKGTLPRETKNVQTLLKGGKVIDSRCDEFGFLLESHKSS